MCKIRYRILMKKKNDLSTNSGMEKKETPWGKWENLVEYKPSMGYKVKRITVNPKECLSLQTHQHRDEFWVVVSGTGRVTMGKDVFFLQKGKSIFIPKTVPHRVENPSGNPLIIIEVQIGEVLEEKDIVRIEDKYGRGIM